MKRIFLAVIVFCGIIMASCPVAAFEVDGISYLPTDGGVIVAEGWYENLSYDNIVHLVIPESVTYENKKFRVVGIGDYAFTNCENLESVRFPDGLVEIGSYAFERCIALKSIKLPDSLSEIGHGVFEGCTRLEEALLPSILEHVPDFMFRGCRSLKRVTLPSNLISIGDEAFWSGDSTFTEIYFPPTLKYIGNWAFYGCKSLTKVIFPDSLKVIGDMAFNSCPIQELILPENVAVGRNAFLGGIRRDKIVFPAKIDLDRSLLFDILYEHLYFSDLLNPAGFGFTAEGCGQGIAEVQCDRLNVFQWVDGEIKPLIWSADPQEITHKWYSDDPLDIYITVNGTGRPIKFCRVDVDNYEPIGVYIKASCYADRAIISGGWEQGAAEVTDYCIRVDDTAYPGVKRLKYEIQPSTGGWRSFQLNFSVKANGEHWYEARYVTSIPPVSWGQNEVVQTASTSARVKSHVNLALGTRIVGLEFRDVTSGGIDDYGKVAGSMADGIILASLKNLVKGHKYEFRPWCKVEGDTICPAQWDSFTIGETDGFYPPEVVTYLPEVVGDSVFVSGYALAGTDEIKSSGIEFRIVPTGAYSTRNQSQWQRIESDNTLVSVGIADMIPGTAYECRSYAETETANYYGDIMNFVAPGESTTILTRSDSDREKDDVEVRFDGDMLWAKICGSDTVGYTLLNINGSILACGSIVCDGNWWPVCTSLHSGIYIVSIETAHSRFVRKVFLP